MPSDRVYMSMKVPKETARLLEEIRKRLQVERPDTVVSRSDALRYCIHSLPAAAAMSPLSLDAEADEGIKREEKGKAKGG